MQPHELRVVAERDDLKEKCEKLSTFLESDLFKTLAFEDQELLRAQLVPMQTYLAILNARIARFK